MKALTSILKPERVSAWAGTQSQDPAQHSARQRTESLDPAPRVIIRMLGAATAAFPAHSLRSGRAAQDERQGACGWKILGTLAYLEKTVSCRS